MLSRVMSFRLVYDSHTPTEITRRLSTGKPGSEQS